MVERLCFGCNTRKIRVILLDEPDAHLHPSLQAHLMDRLSALARDNHKQVLLATHSTEMLRQAEPQSIYAMHQSRHGYLTSNGQRVGLFEGLGSEYAPKLDQLKRCKRVFFVEGIFDESLLRIFAERLNQPLPSNLVCWIYNGNHSQRRILFEQLLQEIPGLQGMSIRDRDSMELAQVNSNLIEHDAPDINGLLCRTWRRRHFENYLLLPAAIARAAGCLESDVVQFLADHWGLAIGPNPTASDCAPGILDARGKEILAEGLPARNGETAKPSIESTFGCSRHDIGQHFAAQEVPEDVLTLLSDLRALCATPSG